MIHVSRAAAVALCVMIAACGSSKSVAPRPAFGVTVQDFEPRAGVSKEEVQTMRDAFVSALQTTGTFLIVDRQSTAAILAEQEFQSDQQTEGQQAKKGKIRSLRKMISGSVGKLGEDYVFNIKMTDVETAAVDFAISKTFNGDLEDVVEDFLPELAADVARSVERK
jgi:hypothetical protein